MRGASGQILKTITIICWVLQTNSKFNTKSCEDSLHRQNIEEGTTTALKGNATNFKRTAPTHNLAVNREQWKFLFDTIYARAGESLRPFTRAFTLHHFNLGMMIQRISFHNTLCSPFYHLNICLKNKNNSNICMSNGNFTLGP